MNITCININEMFAKLCQYNLCACYATHGLPENPITCKMHKSDNYICVKHGKCVADNCDNMACYRSNVNNIPDLCKRHVVGLDNYKWMQYLKCLCCENKATHSDQPNSKVKNIYCANHAPAGFNLKINYNKKTILCCEDNCNGRARYGLPKHKARHCIEHKEVNECVTKQNTFCQFDGCFERNKRVKYGDNKMYCYKHRLPKPIINVSDDESDNDYNDNNYTPNNVLNNISDEKMVTRNTLKRSTNKIIDDVIDKPNDKVIDKYIDKVNDKIIDKVNDNVINIPINKVIDKIIDKPLIDKPKPLGDVSKIIEYNNQIIERYSLKIVSGNLSSDDVKFHQYIINILMNNNIQSDELPFNLLSNNDLLVRIQKYMQYIISKQDDDMKQYNLHLYKIMQRVYNNLLNEICL